MECHTEVTTDSQKQCHPASTANLKPVYLCYTKTKRTEKRSADNGEAKEHSISTDVKTHFQPRSRGVFHLVGLEYLFRLHWVTHTGIAASLNSKHVFVVSLFTFKRSVKGGAPIQLVQTPRWIKWKKNKISTVDQLDDKYIVKKRSALIPRTTQRHSVEAGKTIAN